jgi:co-chaperonin GroES (HSP10)
VWPGKSLGEGKRSEMEVKEWDIVHFTAYAPNEVKLGKWKEEKIYLIIDQASILAVEK